MLKKCISNKITKIIESLTPNKNTELLLVLMCVVFVFGIPLIAAVCCLMCIIGLLIGMQFIQFIAYWDVKQLLLISFAGFLSFLIFKLRNTIYIFKLRNTICIYRVMLLTTTFYLMCTCIMVVHFVQFIAHASVEQLFIMSFSAVLMFELRDPTYIIAQIRDLFIFDVK